MHKTCAQTLCICRQSVFKQDMKQTNVLFFSSAADKVQRLGPESWTNINHSNKDKHNVQAVQKSVAVAKNKPNEKKRQTRTTRKSPSQICVSSQSRKQQNNSRPGPEPKQKKHSATVPQRQRGKSPPKHTCLSTLPDPWPLAKITINMESASQWVSKIGRLFFADECVRHVSEAHATKQSLSQDAALQEVKQLLPELELRVIEFLSEWMVSLLMPAKHLLEIRSPHLLFMLCKDYWFRELYIGLKVAASLDRNESYEKTIDGQIRCITAEFKPKGSNVVWNVNYVNVFIPAWTVPPIYHAIACVESTLSLPSHQEELE